MRHASRACKRAQGDVCPGHPGSCSRLLLTFTRGVYKTAMLTSGTLRKTEEWSVLEERKWFVMVKAGFLVGMFFLSEDPDYDGTFEKELVQSIPLMPSERDHLVDSH